MVIFNVAILLAVILGYVLLLYGLLYSKYPRRGWFLKLKGQLNLESVTNSRPMKLVFDFLTRNKNGRIYKTSHRIITRSETGISVRSLYLLKILSLFTVAVLIILVRYTNNDVTRLSIIAKPFDTFSLFQEVNTGDFNYNIALYNAVVKRIGEDKLEKLGIEDRISEVKKVLPELGRKNGREWVDEKSLAIVKAFTAAKSIRLIDWKTVVIILVSFWLPEIILLLKRILLGNLYRKEVIKLENIFELLGSIRDFKTISIISEMAKSSKVYRKHLDRCLELFKTEKELALESLKVSVKNSRFSRLVDVLRIYSMTDKNLAMQILERNRLEKEEEVFLTAEEDIDLVDLVAFVSIVPILLELANLLMKPMLDVIYEAFKFI